MELTLDCGPKDLSGGWIELKATAGWNSIKLWTDQTKTEEVTLDPSNHNISWWLPEDPEDPVPTTLWVEGYAASGLRGITLQLRYDYHPFEPVDLDTVRITVVDVDLKEISFSGDNYHFVTKDDGSGPYSAPHWQDNSTPYLDGDADDANDRKYPVCFTRNTKMKTSVKMIVAPTAAFGGTVKIRGDGPGNLDIPETTATVNGSEVTITNVECSNAFANHVKWYGDGDILKIKWYISPGDGQTTLSTMPSDNEVFITLDDPACATDFRTVLYLATEGSSASKAVAIIRLKKI